MQTSYYSKHVFVCTNQKAQGKACCANHQSAEIAEYLKTKLLEQEMHGPGRVRVTKSGCLGRCASGPCIVIYPEEIWYRYETKQDIDDIINEHLLAGKIVSRLLMPAVKISQ